MSITTMCEVNLSNAEEFESYLDLLDEAQLQNYNYAFYPYKKDYLNYDDYYFSNARFILYSKASFGRKFCCCGMRNKKNPSGKCCCRHYCPKCSWSFFQKVWHPFEHSFYKGTFQHITLSYTGFAALGKECENIDDVRLHWNAAKYALKQAEKNKYIRGGLVSSEIHIEAFLPTLVNAHVHAVVDADQLSEAVLEQMSECMAKYLVKEIAKENEVSPSKPELLDDDQKARLHLPNIKVVPINDEKAFMNTIQYILKPLILARAYQSTWFEKVVENPDLAVKLNGKLKDFVIGMSLINRNEKRFIRFGDMHSTSKQYIGSVVEDDVDDNDESEEQIAA